MSTLYCLNGVRPRRPEQSEPAAFLVMSRQMVSMESGLEDRNNHAHARPFWIGKRVSMESGLEDRNNLVGAPNISRVLSVSMESGLEDRNNPAHT